MYALINMSPHLVVLFDAIRRTGRFDTQQYTRICSSYIADTLIKMGHMHIFIRSSNYLRTAYVG